MVDFNVKKQMKKCNTLTWDDIEKMLDIVLKSRPNAKKSFIFRDDTPQYIKDNFGNIITSISNDEFKKMIWSLKENDESGKSELVAQLLNKNIEAFADKINICDSACAGTISNTFQYKGSSYVESVFSGKQKAFYNRLNNDAFDFISIVDSKNDYGEERQIFSDSFCKERDDMYKDTISNGTIKPNHMARIVNYLLSKDERDVVQDNLETIANKTQSPLYMLKLLSSKDIDVTNYNRVVNENRANDVIKEMISEKLDVNFERSKDSVETVSMVIKELLNKQMINVSDIKPIGEGGYSKVFKVGDKVVKIGKPPMTYNIQKKSKRFLEPLLRYNFPISRNSGESGQINVTVTEFCNTRENIPEEDVYQIYKELRDEGLVWTDCKASNLGVLNKDNVVHFSNNTHSKDNNGEEKGFNVYHANVGYVEDKDVEVLKAGNLVLTDLDYVYNESDYEKGKYIVPGGGTLFFEFEKRYQKENGKGTKTKDEKLEKEEEKSV